MIGVIEGFTIIFTVILAGYLLARFRIIANDEQRLVLNRVAFYTATPALVFTVVSTSEPTALFSPVVVVSTIAALLTAAVFVLLSRVWFPLDRETTVMGATASSYINSNNIGLPVGMFVLGSAVWAVPILIVQTAIFAPIIFALISNSRRLGPTIISSIFSPIVLGSALGVMVALSGITMPLLVAQPIEILGGASIPMILLSFGASLYKAAPLSDPKQRTPTLIATGLKTLVMPLIAYLVGLGFQLDGHSLYAVVILAALPTAQNVYNYAATFKKGMAVSRDTILVTTFLALPAMLGIAALLQ